MSKFKERSEMMPRQSVSCFPRMTSPKWEPDTSIANSLWRPEFDCTAELVDGPGYCTDQCFCPAAQRREKLNKVVRKAWEIVRSRILLPVFWAGCAFTAAYLASKLGYWQGSKFSHKAEQLEMNFPNSWR